MFEFIALLVAVIAILMVRNQGKRILRVEQQLAALAGVRPPAPATDAAPAPGPQTSPLEVFAPKPADPTAAPDPAAPPTFVGLRRLSPAERMIEATLGTTASSDPEPAQSVPSSLPADGVPRLPPREEPPTKSFEERFGASWVVWIGGLALALGGIFLVQYSIEAGLIGPGVRVFLGGLLATGLVAAGEWTRRREIASGAVFASNAHIPSILTAAGTTVAFATIYAAYALFGFLVPGTAFVLLGIVALATLAAALLHGPWLAALGQVGAFVVPALVAAETPNFWALYIYLAFVTAASFALARARLWRWLVITAVAFATLWMFPGVNDDSALGAPAFHAVVSFALCAALIVSGLLYGPEAESGRIEPVSSVALAAFVFCAGLLVLATNHDAVALAAFTFLVVATVAIAWRTDAAVAAVPFAGALAALVVADWALEFQWASLVVGGGPAVAPDPSRVLYGGHLALGGFFAALFAGAGFLAQGRSSRPEAPILWAATGVIVPLAIIVALYYRIYGFERALPFAALALLIAALFAVATEMLTKREPRPGSASAAAIFATGSIAALALALTFALEKGWLTVALALMVPGIAWIAQQRPLPWLRTLAAIIVGLVVLRVGYEPRIVADAGTTPIFNWILYGYGIPAISFWVAGWLLRRRADDYPARVTDAAAILFSALCFTLEVRHYIYSGDIYWPSAGLTELSLDVIGGLAAAIGLEHIRGRTKSIVHDAVAMIVAFITLLAIGLGLLILRNPWLNGTDVGGVFFNLNLLGYAIPAALAAMLGLMTRRTRPQGYSIVAAVTAVVLALAYLSFQVARIYQGPHLSAGPVSGAEGYTYSAVWLAFGVRCSSPASICARNRCGCAPPPSCSRPSSRCSCSTWRGLTGVWRAFSFIGLGLVLMGIGYLYQRLLFTRKPPAPAPQPEATVTPA